MSKMTIRRSKELRNQITRFNPESERSELPNLKNQLLTAPVFDSESERPSDLPSLKNELSASSVFDSESERPSDLPSLKISK